MSNSLNSSYMRWFRPLVRALRELGGSATRPEATRRVIENEGVTPEELSVTRGRSGQNKVQNEIDWARNTLASGGVIDREVRGRWELTAYGREVELTDELIEEMVRNEREANRRARELRRAQEEEAEARSLGNAGVEAAHYWLYAPGEGASMWEDFYGRGVMGLGWHELGDLSQYPTKEDMRLRLQEVCGNETSQKNSALAVWQFIHDIKPGDVIIAKRGRTEILGRGVVTGDYEYDEDAGRYPNLREVRWTHKGNWTSDGQFAMKTLTDVTDYTDFVEKISGYFEGHTEEMVEGEPVSSLTPYDRERFLGEAYMSEGQYDALVGVLRSKKNVILQGAPGVGNYVGTAVMLGDGP